MNAKKNTGRSFLGTFCLVAIGFVTGLYNVEILAFGQKILTQINSK
jgi:hypothetical protein